MKRTRFPRLETLVKEVGRTPLPKRAALLTTIVDTYVPPEYMTEKLAFNALMFTTLRTRKIWPICRTLPGLEEEE